MQLIRFGQKLNDPIVICLGYFGCMHRGHVALLDTAKECAKVCGAKVALFTFSNNHLRVLGKDVKSLYTFDERLSIYESLGVDFIIAAEFSEQFRVSSGAEFVRQLTEYNLKGVVCGFDYTCGSDRLGSAALQQLLSAGCPVDIVDAVCCNGIKVSTTLIRSLLADNQLAYANELLSQPFFVTGKVVAGRKVGGKIGFPTANLELDSDKFAPVGVYGGKVSLCGKTYKCIVNIGAKPTFGLDNTTVEAHLIDFSGDLYGHELKITLTKFLRSITKFDSADALICQLMADKESVLND